MRTATVPGSSNGTGTAYKVMADGMITGRHYADGKRLRNHIHGRTADHAGARRIVNPWDPQPTIVEAALMAARR